MIKARRIQLVEQVELMGDEKLVQNFACKAWRTRTLVRPNVGGNIILKRIFGKQGGCLPWVIHSSLPTSSAIHPVSLPPLSRSLSSLPPLGQDLLCIRKLFVAEILNQHCRFCYESLVILGFGSAWKVSEIGPNSISVSDSKFDSFGLIWSHAHLQYFSVVLTGLQGFTWCLVFSWL